MRKLRPMSPKFLLFFFSLVFLSSCYSNKGLVYLQDDNISDAKPTLVAVDRPTYRLQPNDILSVQIKSAGETDVSSIFNVGSLQNTIVASPGNFFLEGYTVDASGNITLPILGEITVKGLALSEVRKVIQDHADKYLNNATVLVKLTSFKVTVLGEVRSPGHYFIYNNQATILEALGMAGDLTSFGNRKKIKVIRQVPDGSEVAVVDLTDPKLLQSKFYFMNPGDVIYVEPLRAHTGRSNIEVLSVIFSAVTTAVLILSYVNSN
jgi:polysaccharide export outer membrane protein